jgi:hypothetical protein
MLILFGGKSRISCRFLHLADHKGVEPAFAHFERFAVSKNAAKSTLCVDINSFGR